MAQVSQKANPPGSAVSAGSKSIQQSSTTGKNRQVESRTKANGKQPPNNAVRETALDYLQQGWGVLRLPPRSKKPYNEKWAKHTITNDNVHTLTERDNIGVIFSTAGGLKDIDLDYRTAVDLAKAVGLRGAAFGRGSIIGHYLFDAPGCEAKNFDLPEAKDYPRDLPLHEGKPSRRVLEIRGNDNTMTMFPPSMHPCGEQLEWVGTRREPVKTTTEELRALAGRHAVCSVVLYFYPEDAPARYDCRMALAGALIRSGMHVDMVTRYVQGVARLGGDPKWKEDFAKHTEKRLHADKTTTGLTKLIEVLQLPDACLGTFYEWLNDAPEREGVESDGDTPKPNMPEREWPVLDPAALYGLTGEVVKVIGPHTESDMVALILQFHIAFGNAIGRSAYCFVDGTNHYTNLYGLLVGQSAKSRKGTSGDRIQQLMSTALAMVDNTWSDTPKSWTIKCIKSGLASGEGVVWHIRDEVSEIDENGEKVVKQEGVDDKRMLLDEREFAQCLAVMKREGSTASVVVRKGWDGKPLGNLSKNSPAECAEPHISIIGHITADELRSELDKTSMCSGYANRFLFACVKRSKLLPFGGNLQQSDLDVLAKKVQVVFDKAYKVSKRFEWDTKAHDLWEKVYPELTDDEGTPPGLVGTICGRADPQTLRLALIYAVLDGSEGLIKLPHLKAALALWRYYEASVLYIFGDSLGDPIADTILPALRNNPDGLTRTQISDLFGRNQNTSKIGAALSLLLKRGLITSTSRPTSGKGGRPTEVWKAK